MNEISEVNSVSRMQEYAFRVYPIEERHELHLKDLWVALLRGKWLIAGVSATFAVIAAVIGLAMPPMYRAQTVLAPTSEDVGGGLASLAGQLAGVAALAGVDLRRRSSTEEALATLRSRAFAEGFIARHGLAPILFAEQWDAEAKRWHAEPSPGELFELFDKLREVEQDLQTGMVTLTVDWKDPSLAAQWANQMVADVNEVLRTKALQESEKSLRFLHEELQKASAIEMRQAMYGVIEAEMKSAMLANAKTEYAFSVIDPAVAPEKRHRPRRTLLVIVGVAAGFVLGALTAVIRASLSGHAG